MGKYIDCKTFMWMYIYIYNYIYITIYITIYTYIYIERESKSVALNSTERWPNTAIFKSVHNNSKSTKPT